MGLGRDRFSLLSDVSFPYYHPFFPLCADGVELQLLRGIFLCFLAFQFFVRLHHIRKCFTQKGGIFVLEEFSEGVGFILLCLVNPRKRARELILFFSLPDPKTRQVTQRKYSSNMVSVCTN